MAGSGSAHLRKDEPAVLRVDNLVVEYSVGGKTVHAVSDVSLDLRRGETLGLIGESGCGKSTLAKAILLLAKPTSGTVYFENQDLTRLNSRKLGRTRASLQMIFQDPIGSLNPRRTVHQIVSEGLAIHGHPKPWAKRVDEALTVVGLDPQVVGDRRARELSGGQCQRVALARALILHPALLVCDEPVSALDVSVRAQILNLLEDMKRRYDLTMLFIAHDFAVVKNISDRVAVMYLGKLCEIAPAGSLCENPQHPYTQALLNSVPNPDPSVPERPLLVRGDLPSPLKPPSGCRFRTRCPRAGDRCAQQEPVIRRVAPDHFVACHYPGLDDSAELELSLCGDGR